MTTKQFICEDSFVVVDGEIKYDIWSDGDFDCECDEATGKVSIWLPDRESWLDITEFKDHGYIV